MAYLFIENFEAGLDSRKTAYTAPPGSLRQLINGHINRGKEIEKRKAFVPLEFANAGLTHGLHGAKGLPYVFGDSVSAPAGMPFPLQYQALVSPHGGSLVKVWSTENFDGSIYAIAEYDDGAVHHFYDGTVVTDWETKSATFATGETAAAALARRLEFAPEFAYLETLGTQIFLVGDPGVAVAVVPSVSGGAGTISGTTVQAAVPAAPEVLGTCGFTVTGGSPGPTFNTISDVRVSGVSVTGGAIDFVTDAATTAAAVATRINAYPGTAHTAAAVGADVTITMPAGSGSSFNGDPLQVNVTGDVTVGSVTPVAGGADPVDPIAQVTRVDITAYDADTTYQVSVDGTPYLVWGKYTYMPLFAKSFKDKLWAGIGAQLFFSGFRDQLPDATAWTDTAGPPPVTGTGFLNIATQDRGGEEVIAVGVYQDTLAVYSRQSIQLWSVDPDPDQNFLKQTLINVGAVSAESVVEYGDLDIFALDRTGIRSLRARDSSNLASSDDVGVAIDNQVTAYMREIGPAASREAAGVLEPREGRYLLALGEQVFVFSNFPGSRVSAWSTYDLGGQVDYWAPAGDRLFCRIGDDIQVYGGLEGDTYDDVEVTVTLPFLDAGQPGDGKKYSKIDAGVLGTWSLEFGTEPDDPGQWEMVSTLHKSTYGSAQANGMQGQGTHIALRLKTTTSGPAILGNVLIHFEEGSR